MAIYGNFVVLVSNERSDRAVEFPGGGPIHNYNALNADPIGYVHNDQVFIYRRGTWETTTLSEYSTQKPSQTKPSRYVGFYTSSMKFKTMEFEAGTGSHGDKRHAKRGQICSAQNKKDKQLAYRRLRDLFVSELGAEEYGALTQTIADFYRKKDHCATIEIALMTLSTNKQSSQRWYFLLDDFETIYAR
jgi:hypothetical protein